MLSGNDSKIIKTICPLCLKNCGIDAHLENGRLVKVSGMKEHPFNRLCVKAQGLPDWLYSEKRVTEPLKKSDGEWKKISWDEALKIIADKLERIRENYGAKALVTHLGNPSIGTHIGPVAARFCSLYGTPNFTTGGSLCFVARGIGHGLSLSNHMLAIFPNYKGTRCVIVWGLNPGQSDVNEAANILSAKRKGAKLIVIDPRKTPLAKEADRHAQIRPGTDCALALGLLNVVVTEELYDRDFVESWTVGFDELKNHIKDYTPEVVERITWVPAEMVREIAIAYATNKPAAIAQGVSLDHCANGVQTSRAISILMATTGNLDVPGGNIYHRALRQTSLRVKGRVKVDEAIGAQYPIYGRFTSETTSTPVPEAIISGRPYPVKALIIQGSNSLLTWPNTTKINEAFSKLDLLVVADMFMTKTGELADVFLPAASFLEQEVLQDYSFVGQPLLALGNKVMEPIGNCLEDWRMWAELGKRMGYSSYFPWQDTDELFQTLLEPSDITLKLLRENPGGILYESLDKTRKYLKEGFATPSGKFEIFSSTMEKYGYEPLPNFAEPAGGPISPSDLSGEYPFILVTGTRVNAFTHSRFRDIAKLRKLAPEPLVEINTDSAKMMGIANGEMVNVISPKGSIKLRAKLTDDIHPKVVSLQHGWAGANANILISDEELDPTSAYPAFKGQLCQVVKAE